MFTPLHLPVNVLSISATMSNSVSSVGVMTLRTVSETYPIEQWMDSCPRIDIYKKPNIHKIGVEPTVVIAFPQGTSR